MKLTVPLFLGMVIVTRLGHVRATRTLDTHTNIGMYLKTIRHFQAIPESGRGLRQSKGKTTSISQAVQTEGSGRLWMSGILNSHAKPENLEEIENFVGDYKKDGLKTRLGDSPYNVSDKCLNHTMTYFEGLLAGEIWALEMFDALGKPTSGILQGHLLWPGSYDQCLGVEAILSNSSQPLFRGEYCSVITVIPLGGAVNGSSLFPGSNGGPLLGIQLNIGLCLPNSCDIADVTALMRTGMSLLPVNLTALPLIVGCAEEQHLSKDGRAIAVLFVTSAICLLLLLGTAYDVVFIQIPKSEYESVQDLLASADLANAENDPKIQKLLDDESLPLLDGKIKVETQKPPEPGIGGRLLVAFSLYTNASKILSTKQAAGSLHCLNGIRFISMSWVMLAHTFAFLTLNGLNVMTYFPEFLGRMTAQPIVNGTFSVDSFFLLSGFLVTYLTLKEMGNKEGKLNWFLYYFHRYWRLTPTLMLIMMVYVPLFKYWGEGPYWPKDGLEVDYCSGTCSRIAGTATVVAFLLASTIAPGIISINDEAGAGVAGLVNTKAFDDIYIKPWCRMGPYLVGMSVGYILYKTKCKVDMPKVLVLVGWLAAFTCGVAVVYGMQDVNDGGIMAVEVSALYNAVARTSWGLAVGWVIFACCTGYGGVVNSMLSWNIFAPLSRLTYCTYLIHPMVMYWFYLNQQVPIFVSDINLIYFFFAHMVTSYVVAFVVSLAFEAPAMGLEKVILHRERRS